MFRSAPQLLITVLILGLLLMRQARQPPLAGIEEAFIYWLAGNSAGEQAAAPVALVQIDEESLAAHPWPWSPLDYALFLDCALHFQAAVAAIEPVLSWDEKTFTPEQSFEMPQMMPILHERILRTPKLLLGAELGFPDEAQSAAPAQPLPALSHVQGSLEAVPEFSAIQAEPGGDIRLTAALGFTNLPELAAAGGAIHRAPLIFRCHGQAVPSFVLQGLMLWYGFTPDEVRVRSGTDIVLGNALAIPIDRTGAMLVDWQTPCVRVSYGDFLLSVEQMENRHPPLLAPETFRGKLLLLARTDAPAQTLVLPSGQHASVGELFAAALATAQMKAFIRPAGWPGDLAVLLAALWLAAFLMARPRVFAIPGVLAFGAVYLLCCLVLFESARIVMPLTPAVGLALFIGCFRLAAPTVKPS